MSVFNSRRVQTDTLEYHKNGCLRRLNAQNAMGRLHAMVWSSRVDMSLPHLRHLQSKVKTKFSSSPVEAIPVKHPGKPKPAMLYIQEEQTHTACSTSLSVPKWLSVMCASDAV
jgi:hypothetical protein